MAEKPAGREVAWTCRFVTFHGQTRLRRGENLLTATRQAVQNQIRNHNQLTGVLLARTVWQGKPIMTDWHPRMVAGCVAKEIARVVGNGLTVIVVRVGQGLA
jgi:hypothetical protein